MLISKKFDWCSDYGLNKVEVYISDNRDVLTIYNSSKIRKTKHIKEVLSWLNNIDYIKPIFNHGINIASREWRVHNLLYNLKIQISRTEHVDYKSDQSCLEAIAYFLLSFLYFY
jgi:hypothetical protein